MVTAIVALGRSRAATLVVLATGDAYARRRADDVVAVVDGHAERAGAQRELDGTGVVHRCAMRNTSSASAQKEAIAAPVRSSVAVTDSVPGRAKESSTVVVCPAGTSIAVAVAADDWPTAHWYCVSVLNWMRYVPGRTLWNQTPSESLTAA